ncbi:MAG: DedA family protein [Ferrimicrobium sp.]
MQHIIEQFVRQDGLVAIFVLMTLESAIIPIPSELVMTLAGFFAATGRLNLVWAIVVAIVANVVGSYVLYIVGRTGGRTLVERFGKYVFVKERDLDRAEEWFARHGEPAVIVSRLLPVVRSIISLPAGIAEMPPAKFGLYTLIGSTPFVALLALAGYWLGSSFNEVVTVVQDAGYLIAAVLVIAIVTFLWRRARQRRQLSTE